MAVDNEEVVVVEIIDEKVAVKELEAVVVVELEAVDAVEIEVVAVRNH